MVDQLEGMCVSERITTFDVHQILRLAAGDGWVSLDDAVTIAAETTQLALAGLRPLRKIPQAIAGPAGMWPR